MCLRRLSAKTTSVQQLNFFKPYKVFVKSKMVMNLFSPAPMDQKVLFSLLNSFLMSGGVVHFWSSRLKYPQRINRSLYYSQVPKERRNFCGKNSVQHFHESTS